MLFHPTPRTILHTESYNATTSAINLGANVEQDTLVQTAMTFCYPVGSGEGTAGYLFGLTTSATSNGPRFIHNHNSGNPQFGLQINSTGTAGAPVHNSNSNSAPYNNWYHAAATYAGTINSSDIQVYIGKNLEPMTNQTTNGANNVEGSGSASVTAGRNLFIGNREGTDRTFNGLIAYVARWNRVLTLTEMLQAQFYGPLTVPNGLILCWSNGRDYGPFARRPTSKVDVSFGGVPPMQILGIIARRLPRFGVGVAPSFIPSWAAQHNAVISGGARIA